MRGIRISRIKEVVQQVVREYDIKRVVLAGNFQRGILTREDRACIIVDFNEGSRDAGDTMVIDQRINELLGLDDANSIVVDLDIDKAIKRNSYMERMAILYGA
ncbi:MAG: hypothetical protein ATN35_06695 [Epulopiscium sp. Nele67-Bin004]|nr:MAG: hypothetical protein ATN35_06695 [Epulopiscium sp. Nele67-Bin004]